MIEFKKGVALKATPLLMVFFAILLAPALQVEATVIKDLRFGDNKAYLRMVIELDRPLDPPPSVSISRNMLQVALSGIIDNLTDRQTVRYHRDIVSLDITQTSDATRIDAAFSFTPADVKTFSLTDPHRFIIDAYRPLAPAAATPPIEKVGPITSNEATAPIPNPTRTPVIKPPVESSPPTERVSIKATGSASPPGDNTEDLRRRRLQQRLIAALIVVTSIIAVLLFFLIWMSNRQEKPQGPTWIDDLPPAADRDIENINVEIGKHLKIHDHR